MTRSPGYLVLMFAFAASAVLAQCKQLLWAGDAAPADNAARGTSITLADQHATRFARTP